MKNTTKVVMKTTCLLLHREVEAGAMVVQVPADVSMYVLLTICRSLRPLFGCIQSDPPCSYPL